jgi:hypothetical protein
MAYKTTENLQVEVVYALPGDTTVIPVVVAAGSSIADAIHASGIEQLHPEIDLDANKVGVFSRIKSPGDELYDGDRIEIYRPITADPKATRRRRAARENSA